MRHIFVLTAACACALTAALVHVHSVAAESTGLPNPADLQAKIDTYRKVSWRWQRLMGRPLTIQLPAPRPPLEARVPLWRAHSTRMQRLARKPPHKRQWLCIHGYEGPWNANTGNGFFGGLQMDRRFQLMYAPAWLLRKGTADHWSAIEQMWVAERAYRSGRGFYPWPNTARYCGFIA
jgi:hypothetical protein